MAQIYHNENQILNIVFPFLAKKTNTKLTLLLSC